MAEAFDPDKYLAEKRAALAAAAPPFDPDKYLAEKTGALRQASAPDDSAQPKDVTIDGPGTRLFHLARHLAFGAGDKLIAAEQAARDAYQDKTGHPLDAFTKSYGNNLAFNDKVMDASDRAHPLERWEGNLGGFLGSSAALAVPGMLAGAGAAGAQALPKALALRQAARQGATLGGLFGGIGGYGASRSDSAPGTAGNTILGSLLGVGSGAAAPYVADYAGRGAQYLGNKAQDLAGWLKVNSIHPTPTLGEAMEEVPGGAQAVGRELLSRNIGGLTKQGTADQIEAAFRDATGHANALAAAHDAAGGSVDMASALQAAQARAAELMDEPATREAGQRLQNLVGQYAEHYGAGEDAPALASDALATKRALGRIAYGAKQDFKLNSNPVSGDYGAGVRQFERDANSALLGELGPEYGQANLLVRRLGGAKDAAERAAARTMGNHVLGLMPLAAGAIGATGGHMAGSATPEALAWGLGAMLAGKYGAQVGARTLYGLVGGGLGLAGRGLQALPVAASSAAASQVAAPAGISLADLLAAYLSNAKKGSSDAAGQGAP